MVQISSQSLLDKLNQIEIDTLKRLNQISTFSELEILRIEILGKKGKLAKITAILPRIENKQRIIVGRRLNKLKNKLSRQISKAKNQIPKTEQMKKWVDLTRPTYPQKGSLHLITQAIREIVDIFSQIGFIRVVYPEIDWDWYAFESLNMPQNHPARDEWETFFINYPKHPKFGNLVLTPHTSNGQVRELRRLKKPPVRMINIARCYRRQHDLTHTPMFHQFEGLVVDKGINLTHLKGTLEYFAKTYYGKETKLRLRPFHFQFTEPSFEVDFSCVHCSGTGCKFCKAGWHEVGGAGMVHPKVLINGGFDPKKYTGFAFGWGIERTLSLRPDIRIDDIRLFYENDIRFLRQF